jgi:hypothetical protein
MRRAVSVIKKQAEGVKSLLWPDADEWMITERLPSVVVDPSAPSNR